MAGEALKHAVGATIDALKAQPATLALIVMSFGLLVYLFYEGKDTHAILANCVMPENFQSKISRDQIQHLQDELNALKKQQLQHPP